MKKNIFIFILIIFCGCSKKPDDIRITKFEEALGKSKTEALNLLVEDFEKNLDKLYPKLEKGKAYSNYMTDIIAGNTYNHKKFNFKSDKTQKKIEASGLKDDLYSKTIQGLQPNLDGQFLKYLNEISNTDPLIKKYFEKKKILGNAQIELFLNDFIKSDTDYSDYFHKRIVISEFIF